MSYSRWSGSDWYVFHTCTGSSEDPNGVQMLAVWSVNHPNNVLPDYSDDEIREFIETPSLMENIPGFDPTSKTDGTEYLLVLFKEFIEDVDEDRQDDI